MQPDKRYTITMAGRNYRVREFTTTPRGLADLMATDVLVVDAVRGPLGMVRVTVAERA